MKTSRRLLALTPLCALFAAGSVHATNGYFSHGYGMKALGMGGVSMALAQDTLGGANNPASMVWVGNRLDLGANVFMPKRDAERSGSPIPPINGYIESDSTAFLVPEFGYNRMLSSDLAVGVSVYGNGGLNTDYPQGNFQCPTATGFVPANILCGSGELGVDLMQLIIAPTVAYKLNAQHAIGASLLLGYQRFEAKGLQAFAGLTADPSNPSNLTNEGADSSTGFGLRVGYQGRLTDTLTIGAAYATKMSMREFDKYSSLFAENGGFDIPSNFSIGVAFAPTPEVTIAADYGRIYYSDARSVSNPSQPVQAPLGAANGPGFGWQDIDVFKLGVSWRMSEAWTLRAGYNRGDNPIIPRDVTFNILAPGVMKDHYTAGFTYSLDKANEITGAFMVAPRQTVTGASFFNGLFPSPPFPANPGGNETIGMKQSSIGLAWARKF